MSGDLQGYEGIALQCLRRAEAKVGDTIKILQDGNAYEGLVMPRPELGDDKHIVIKLKSGYNIGVMISEDTKIERVRSGISPRFVKPSTPKQKSNLPSVAILSTGGTIASRVDYRTGGVRPALTANDLYSIVPELSNIARIKATIVSSLFSENITPSHWTQIAERVAEQVRDGVDGVVVPHGTDTMGFTAAALSFALQDLPVPVIIVGSQRSADRPSSDAAQNLIGAVKAAANAPFAEVAIAMHETVSDKKTVYHLGTRARKCHTSRRDAFKSINVPPLAKLEDNNFAMMTENYHAREPTRKLILKQNFNEDVALVKFYPGIKAELIDWQIDRNIKGLVLEGTGLGHISNSCFDSIKEATSQDIIVAMTSQCLWGRVNMHVYNTGRDLLKLGVIPLGDMLPETALVKMMWILAHTENLDKAKHLLTENIAHEISERTIYHC